MAFAEVLFFEVCSTLLDTSAKMPPADRRRPHKRREATGGHRDMGKRKPAPGKPRAGAGGIQDFFAVSQMIIKGRIKINRTINLFTPFHFSLDSVPR